MKIHISPMRPLVETTPFIRGHVYRGRHTGQPYIIAEAYNKLLLVSLLTGHVWHEAQDREDFIDVTESVSIQDIKE